MHAGRQKTGIEAAGNGRWAIRMNTCLRMKSDKRLHVRDFTRHQKLRGVYRSWIVGEINKPLVNDFGAGFRRDVAAEIHIQLARR